MIILTLVLTGCLAENEVRLPDLEDKVKDEILVELTDLELSVVFTQRAFVELERSEMFIEYGNFMSSGDVVEKGDTIPVIISATLFDEGQYFEPADITYDGPLFDFEFLDYDAYEYSDETYIGTGGAFYVNYDPINSVGRCIDGDTTVFEYPQEIYNMITGSAKSTRYFNVDTPETYSGAEEEWGKPATHFVCDTLLEAEAIILQTDPGDNLLDRYNRLLAWIWVQMPGEEDFFLLNYMIVRQGLGEVAYLYGAGETDVTMFDGLTYTEWMFLAEDRAKSEGLGMHGQDLDWYWDYEHDRPYPGRW